MDQTVAAAFSHQFHLAPVGVSVLFPPVVDDDAVAVQGLDPTSVLIRTGIASGPVTVSFGHGPPSDEHLRLTEHGWDLTRLTIPVEEPLVLYPTEDDLGYEAFEPDAPGLHHVLVAGTGRDTHWDLAMSTPVEEYLILIWPVGA
jgi:hypothetical protein